MREFVKSRFAVWTWASHFPSLGLNHLSCCKETVIAVLPASHGSRGSSKQCWADFLAPALRRK